MLTMSAPRVAAAVPATTTVSTSLQQQARTVYRSVREVPRPKDGRITDLAGYGLERSSGLANAIREFERQVKAPVYVVTLPSIGAPKSGVKNYATRLFNEWSIGNRGTQKGVLVLIVKDVRRVEVEVGNRLNSIVSRSWTTRMLENSVLPTLKDGAYASGIERAVGRLAARIENGNKPLPKNWYRSPGYWASSGKTEEAVDALTALAVGAGGSVLAIGAGANAIASNRRDRTCDACGGVVIQEVLNEDPVGRDLTADNFEALGLDPALSLSFKPTTAPTIKRVGKWRTIVSPTYGSQGRRERTLRCHKCGAVSTKVQIIPRLMDTSSDSGSDGSSDGGGGGGGDF